MALFYPATFGIVGQKMTTLQHRSQGDPEDPHDEHYLLATQSKQEQVRTSGGRGNSFLPKAESLPRINRSS
jgi:actin-related protein 8